MSDLNQTFWLDCMDNIAYETVKCSDLEIGDIITLNNDDDDLCGTFYIYDIETIDMHQKTHILVKVSKLGENQVFDSLLLDEDQQVIRRKNMDDDE